MRAIGLLFLLVGVLVIWFSSCQRDLDPVIIPSIVDSSPAGSIIRFVSFNSRNDSIIDNFQYDAKGNLVKKWNNDDSSTGSTLYLRDDNERISKIKSVGPKTITPEGNFGSTIIGEVHYTDEVSNQVLYSIDYNTDSASRQLDSMIYFYENGRMNRVNIYHQYASTSILDYYYTYSYDVKGNVVRINGYEKKDDGTFSFNLGYELSYDDNNNPFYSHDDILNVYNWSGGSSNNIIKQINHYNVSDSSDDYIINEYKYNEQKKPVSVVWSGPKIKTVHAVYYYK